MNDKVKKGFYLVTIGHCMECHTPKVNDRLDFANGLGIGGQTFRGPFGESVSRNITSHREKGIGAWSDAEIIAAAPQKKGGPEGPPNPDAVCRLRRGQLSGMTVSVLNVRCAQIQWPLRVELALTMSAAGEALRRWKAGI
jgi:hypothetical protein